MMSIRNCPGCGTLFVAGPRSMCSACMQQEDKEFEVVKQFLHAHPDAVLADVSDATGVEQQTVLRFIRSSRLVVAKPQSFGLACERCGDPVATGQLCTECAKELTQEIRGLDIRGRTRMHSVELDRRR